MRSRYLLAASMIVLIVFIAGCEATLTKADKAMAAGDYQKAITLYNEVLDSKKMKAPEMAEVRYKLGHALDKIDKQEDAVEQYRLAIDLKPDESKFYMAMAEDLDMLGLVDDESNVLKKAEILQPKDALLKAKLGTAYAKLGQFNFAQQKFDEAVALDPKDPQNHVNLGLLAVKLGDPKKAIAHWQDALKLDPKNENALTNLGAVYNNQNMVADAVVIYKKNLDLDTKNIKRVNTLGVAYYNNAEYDKAYKQFQIVSSMDPKYPGLTDSLRLARRGMNVLSKTGTKKHK